MDRALRTVYYTPKNANSFSTPLRLYKHFKGRFHLQDIKKWLASKDSYTLHRPARKRFRRNKYHVTNIDEYWESDLVDMSKFHLSNDGYKFILNIIDVFSKYSWSIPLKSKSATNVSEALHNLISTSERIPIYFRTDKGKEYLNAPVRRIFELYKIKHITTENSDIKCSVVERFNKTLKNKMTKYMTHKDTQRYIDVLQDLITSYNNTIHSTIKMRPTDVNDKNVLQVYNTAFRDIKVRVGKSKSLKIGDHVRISLHGRTFHRGYEVQWTTEIFKIFKMIPRKPRVYKLTDLKGEDLTGVYYDHELQKVDYNEQSAFKVDKILGTRTRNGRKELLVSWQGWPEKFNSYIPASNLRKK